MTGNETDIAIENGTMTSVENTTILATVNETIFPVGNETIFPTGNETILTARNESECTELDTPSWRIINLATKNLGMHCFPFNFYPLHFEKNETLRAKLEKH